MGVTSKSAMVRFAVTHRWDVEQEVAKLRQQLAANTAQGLVRSNAFVLQRLAMLMDDRDETDRLRNQR